MPASNPSPPPPASGTVAGIVSLIAQTFAGVKTFLARVVIGVTSGTSLDLSANTSGSGSVVQLANGAGINFSVADANSYLARVSSNTIRQGDGTTGTMSAGVFAAGTSMATPRLQLNTGDSTGAPGNATVNFSAGKSSVNTGATTCVITTNQAFGTGDIVHITPLTINAAVTKWSAVAASGSFTVTVDAAPTGSPWQFQWSIFRKNN